MPVYRQYTFCVNCKNFEQHDLETFALLRPIDLDRDWRFNFCNAVDAPHKSLLDYTTGREVFYNGKPLPHTVEVNPTGQCPYYEASKTSDTIPGKPPRPPGPPR